MAVGPEPEEVRDDDIVSDTSAGGGDVTLPFESDEPPPGTLLGATALVAGTTVGAGIIALPAKTLAAGFLPSSAFLVLGWAYMASTGLLLAEVNVNTLCALERSAVSLNSMAEQTLGAGGARLTSASFIFLHICLLTAYTLQGGELLLEALTELSPAAAQIPAAAGAPAFAAVLTAGLVCLPQPSVERANNVLVVGVLAAFLALVSFGAPQVQPELLAGGDIGAAVRVLPVLPVAYVYQTVVPTLCYSLGCDLGQVRTAILGGTALPLLMFLACAPYRDSHPRA